MIDKVGSLLGRTQGASKDAGLAMYKTALKLNPTSAIAARRIPTPVAVAVEQTANREEATSRVTRRAPERELRGA